MLIAFKNLKIHVIITNDDRLVRKLGLVCAKKLKRRLDDLRAAKTLSELRNAPGSYTMTSEKLGQFSCGLDSYHSLVFESSKKPLPKNGDREVDWAAIDRITIVDLISNK